MRAPKSHTDLGKSQLIILIIAPKSQTFYARKLQSNADIFKPGRQLCIIYPQGWRCSLSYSVGGLVGQLCMVQPKHLQSSPQGQLSVSPPHSGNE
jgi:hypothetical protein